MDAASVIDFPARAAAAEDAAVVLHGRLRRPPPDVASRGAAVLCHPHPAFGGHMDVWLLPRIGEALAADGWTVLRFDVRSAHGRDPDGAGGAGDGTAEALDLAGALDALDALDPPVPGDRRAVVGWSFGALLGLLHGPTDPRVTDWVGIAPPTGRLEGVPMRPFDPVAVAAWAARRSVVAGRHDQFFAPEDVEMVAPHAVHLLDTDHFFFDLDDEVAGLVVAALRTQGTG